MSNREDLKKQAQEKLVQARTLIYEAGQLAKEGQFYLYFGEIGEFVPSSIDDREALRAEALELLKSKGRDNGGRYVRSETEKYGDGSPAMEWIPNPPTPYSDLSEEEVEEQLEQLIEGLLDGNEVSYDAREYATRDTWWAPSRC